MMKGTEERLLTDLHRETCTIRKRRVGTVTIGFTLICFGVLFLMHLFFGYLDYRTIFMFWPLIFIGLGIEVLLSSTPGTHFVYDKGAIVLLLLMGIFAALMAGIDLGFSHMELWEKLL